MSSTQKRLHNKAIILSKMTSDLPLQTVSFVRNWRHLSSICYADPDFGLPGRVGLLLGVDVFTNALLHDRQSTLQGSPAAFETCFEFVAVLITLFFSINFILLVSLYSQDPNHFILAYYWVVTVMYIYM